MKKIITLLLALVTAGATFAQAPQKMSYQAIVRNAANTLVTNSSVGMRISILQGTATGSVVYQETQTATTNTNGLVTISIGNGTVVSGNFSTITWGNNLYFVKTETDPTGGTSYTITGTTQIMSVPYALDAKNAENFTGAASGDLTGNYPNPTINTAAVTGTKIANSTIALGKLSATGTASANNFLQGDNTWSAVDLSTADVTGTLPISKINTTNTASGTTFLRGDGSWQTPAGGASLPTQTGNAGKTLITDGTTASWGTSGASVYDAANVKLGTLLTFSTTNLTVLTSTGYVVPLLMQPNSGAPLATSQIYWTVSGCSGTPYFNGGTVGTYRYAKSVVYSAVASQIYAMANPNANGMAISVAITAASLENPACTTSAGTSGYALTPVSMATIGLPATITYPISMR